MNTLSSLLAIALLALICTTCDARPSAPKIDAKFSHMSYYDILEVDSHAKPRDIKKAYHAAALKYHPDVPGGDAERFVAIRDAHEFLANVDKRKKYDFLLEHGIKAWDESKYETLLATKEAEDNGDWYATGGDDFYYDDPFYLSTPAFDDIYPLVLGGAMTLLFIVYPCYAFYEKKKGKKEIHKSMLNTIKSGKATKDTVTKVVSPRTDEVDMDTDITDQNQKDRRKKLRFAVRRLKVDENDVKLVADSSSKEEVDAIVKRINEQMGKNKIENAQSIFNAEVRNAQGPPKEETKKAASSKKKGK